MDKLLVQVSMYTGAIGDAYESFAILTEDLRIDPSQRETVREPLKNALSSSYFELCTCC